MLSLSLSLLWLTCLRANQPKRNKRRLGCSWQRNINKNHIELHHERKEGNEFKFAFHVIYGGNDFYSRLTLAHGEKVLIALHFTQPPPAPVPTSIQGGKRRVKALPRLTFSSMRTIGSFLLEKSSVSWVPPNSQVVLFERGIRKSHEPRRSE